MDKKPKKVKILVLTSFYYPHWTGIVQYAISLAEGLVKQNFDVKVWTIAHEPQLRGKEDINGVMINRAKADKKISRTWISAEYIFKLGEQIAGSDRVVVFLPMAEVLLASVLAKMYRKKIYLIHNGDLVLTKGLWNWFLERVFFTTTNLAIKLSTGIIVNTVDYAKSSKLLSKNSDKWLEIIPPFLPLQANTRAKKEIMQKIGKVKNVVGFAGRFVEEKGFDILLKAIPLVVSQRPGTKFVFAGEVNIAYENTFKKLSREWNEQAKNIVALGKLDRSAMGSLYAVCDIFAVSSRSDFFPFTQAEALLAGVPVVVTNIPGARWPVTMTKMGLIVRPENPEDLARGIVEALDSKDQLTKNYDKAKAFFDYNKVIKKYTELLK